jgi:monofunctional biosynthetic peptidoglycan transglycosylase
MDQETGDAPKPEEPLVVLAAVLPDEPVGESAVEPVAPPKTPTAPAPQPANPISPSKPKRKPHWVRRSLIALVLLLFVVPPVLTVIYRVVPPPITILMIERLAQGQGLDKQWRGLSDISPALPQAVIAAEDARFCEHHGFDFEAIRKAALHNQRRPGKVRGGSTISQQTAKNVFLWPSRDYVRKGLEAWFTVLEEAIWGKRRILETYLNVVEWGPGTYGAEAAARRYFHRDAADLTQGEAARLAAILPDPLKWKAANPGPYIQRRSAKIGARAAVVRDDDLAWCVRR